MPERRVSALALVAAEQPRESLTLRARRASVPAVWQPLEEQPAQEPLVSPRQEEEEEEESRAQAAPQVASAQLSRPLPWLPSLPWPWLLLQLQPRPAR